MPKHSKELLAEKQHCKVSKKVWNRRHGDQSSDKKSSPEVVEMVPRYDPVIIHGLAVEATIWNRMLLLVEIALD